MWYNLLSVYKVEAELIYDCLKLASEQLIASESRLNDLDKQSGDGDCGNTMARGAQGKVIFLYLQKGMADM